MRILLVESDRRRRWAGRSNRPPLAKFRKIERLSTRSKAPVSDRYRADEAARNTSLSQATWQD